MKIAIGADHGGFEYKQKLIEHLVNSGYKIEDFGTYSTNACDYPIIAKRVAESIVNKKCERGILICGTGIGMSIAANKIKGIRAALCGDTFSARATRAHNDSNILCLGQRVIGEQLAIDITDVWLNTEFSNDERHKNRINMIEE